MPNLFNSAISFTLLIRKPVLKIGSGALETAPAMARLHEYQGKAILAANGFKIPRGRAASSPDEAVEAAKELIGKSDGEVVIKIQAWTTGRAGIGGVTVAAKADDVRGH